MTCAFDCLVWQSHVNTDSDFICFAFGLGRDYDRRYPVRGTVHTLNNVQILQPFQFSFHLFPKVKRNSPMRLCNWLNVWVNIQFYLGVFRLPYSCENLGIFLALIVHLTRF